MLIALVRAVLTYRYNMITARLTQGEIVPDIARATLCEIAALELQLL